ncbi:MAG: glutamate 5-kinase [Kiritimatiellae bacterium]|nr:glutamate 5-kinase [Kiritimatiellia bacterium]
MNINPSCMHRERLRKLQRVVVKVGSRVLVQRNGRPDLLRIKMLVKEVVSLRRVGIEVVLVSSGAVGAGMEALGLKKRPTDLPDLQMAAAIGQTRLMAMYERLFSAKRYKTGQVLLTHDDFKNPRRRLNARSTMLNLLRNNIIPIVNENDVVAVDEIKVGDNDILASLVSLLIRTDALILLSVVDGLREPTSSGRTRRVSLLEEITRDTLKMATGVGSILSIGGMATKLKAAQTVTKSGAMAVIANGRKEDVLTRIIKGEDVGTLVVGHKDKERRKSKVGR